MHETEEVFESLKHNEDPDSPRSATAPTVPAHHSMQPAQFPGYHSNSDYGSAVVNHHITNTYTQMASRGAACVLHKHTLPFANIIIHVLVQTGMCNMKETYMLSHICNNLITGTLMCIYQMFSLSMKSKSLSFC